MSTNKKYWKEVIVDRLKYSDAVTMEDFKSGEFGLTRPEWLGIHFVRNGKYCILLKTGEVIESPEHIFDTDKKDWILVSFSSEARIRLNEYFNKNDILIKVSMNEEQQKLLMDFLESNNIKVEINPSALYEFYEQEAEFRIEMNYEDLTEEEIDEITEKCKYDIADEFYNSEYVLNYDLLDEITRDIVDEYLEEA